MNYKGHKIGGLLIATTYVAILMFFSKQLLIEWWEYPLVFATVFYFGLFPDVDTNSTIRNFTLKTSLFAILVLLVFEKITPAIYLTMALFSMMFLTHRGLTHNILFIIGASATIATLFGIHYGIATLIGLLMHLLLDSLKIRRKQ